MKPVQGEKFPVERSVHAACCLNYDQDHPQLLVYGGVGNGKTLGDMWMLNLDTGKWTEVSIVLLLLYTCMADTLLCFGVRMRSDTVVCLCVYLDCYSCSMSKYASSHVFLDFCLQLRSQL